MIKTINKEKFVVYENEFNKIPHEEFNNLILLESLGLFERLTSLLRELTLIDEENQLNLICKGVKHGGFIPIKCANKFNHVFILNSDENDNYNIIENIESKGVKNISFIENQISAPSDTPSIFFNNDKETNFSLKSNYVVILSATKLLTDVDDFIHYALTGTEYYVYVRMNYHEKFLTEFNYFILTVYEDNKSGPFYLLNYDNLLHLCMIVKNAGDGFEQILIDNFQHFDRWTILDTGSTDNTMEIIKKVLVGKKKGNLYEEPFINFRDSRNRCIDLAGKECKFIINLDDTYTIRNDLRLFLNTIRGDQFADTLSMFIQSYDTEYGSNRILKSKSGIRYKYKLHEVLDPKDNINVIIPLHHSHIFDVRSDYMEKRTMDRKKYDLKVLQEMYNEDPKDSRPLYYLGTTYNLLERYESALEFFLKRVDHEDTGFIQEKIDACFEAARLCNFKLNKPWNECERLYMKAYNLDTSRPESLYFIGIHYYLEKDFAKAYTFMKKAFEIGYPIHCQYSLKPTLSFFFLPKFLAEICFIVNDVKLGLEASELFLIKNDELDGKSGEHQTVKCWNKILMKLRDLEECKPVFNAVPLSSKPIVVFNADGGFSKWTGSDILSKGVGGSETFVIEMSRYIQRSEMYDVYVFCNCSREEKYDNVCYLKLESYPSFIKNNKIHTVIISRYPEYLPMTYKSNNVENVHLILHDLIPNGEVIIKHEKLRNVFCLTNWHAFQFNDMFPDVKERTKVLNYGVDFNLFESKEVIDKVPFKFMYSSFANRGLLVALKMWPNILARYPQATFHIYCDIENAWLNIVKKDEMDEIREILKNCDKSIQYHGWVSKKELSDAFRTSEVLFYPCTFLETFCLTALEAAISKTLVITSKLGALNEVVGNRGLTIDGDPNDEEWQRRCFQALGIIMEDRELKDKIVNKNYKWALGMQWKDKANELLKIISGDDRVKVKEDGEKNPENKNTHSKILDYFNFKTNRKVSKILEIGNISKSKHKLITELFSLVNHSEIHSLVEIKNFDSDTEAFKLFLRKMNSPRLKYIESNDILSILNDETSDKYDMILLNDYFEDTIGFSVASICFKILKNGGLIGFINSPISEKSIDLFIQKNSNDCKVLQKDAGNVFLEKKYLS